jgi:hypothetical protein
MSGWLVGMEAVPVSPGKVLKVDTVAPVDSLSGVATCAPPAIKSIVTVEDSRPLAVDRISSKADSHQRFGY